MLERTVFLQHLAEMDAQLSRLRNKVADAKDELEMVRRKRDRFARENCLHAQTYERSIMGREYERRCKDCDIEL
jgi:hypothetical protein